MYIRKTDGRDRGQCFDVREEEARELIAHGQATAVDFSEPDPLGTRELKMIEPAVVPEVQDPHLSNTAKDGAPSFVKSPAGKFHKKSSR